MTTSIGRNSGSTATPKKATFSYWLKGRADGTQQGIWGWHRGNDAANYWLGVYYSTNDSMYFNWKQGGSYGTIRGTSQKFRDPSAWGHHVISIDSTLSTAADRVKWYVNGERITSFEDSSYTLAENATITNWSNAQDKMEIGTWYQSSTARNLNNHCLSHFHFTDGYAYQASSFGSTDSTTGQWTINTAPSVTYGNEGFFVLKDGNTITDSSPNSNNFSLDGGTLTKTEDCPDNNFTTFNPLTYHFSNQWQANTNGNTTANGGSGSAWKTILTTLGDTSGKYYFEAKLITLGSNCIIGAVDINDSRQNSSTEWYMGQSSTGQGYQNNGAASNGGASYGASYTNGDIIGVAIDLDNYKMYFHKNGTYQNSGNPTSGSTGTGAMSLTANTTYAFAVTSYAGTIWNANFGNGHFGTTAVSSAGTNASGIGIFEYDVPTGYTALSTKGLNL